MGRLIVTATTFAIVVFAGIDLVRLGPSLSGSGVVAVCGYVLLSAALLAVVGGLCLGAATLIAQSILARNRTRGCIGWSLVAIVAAVPAGLFARIVTEGQGISASAWKTPVQIAVLVAVVGGILLLVRVLQIVPNWSEEKRRRAGALALGCGGLAVAVTTFHATTYLRVHLGFLLMASVAFHIAFALTFARPEIPAGRRRRATAFRIEGLVAFAAIAYAMTLHGAGLRPKAGLVVFSNTVIAQKLTPVLFWISPVYAPGEARRARPEFEATRLGRSNSPAVTPLVPGRFKGHNVVWVSADAFRADAIGGIHNGASVTPHLDELSRQALVFSEAIADYSHTSMSILSVLSGRWDVAASMRPQTSGTTADDINRNRLPRLLRQSGYHTLADMVGRPGQRHFSQKQFTGFDQHVEPGPTCIQQVEYLERFLSEYKQPKPFFAWMHIYDTHKPLQHPDENVSPEEGLARDYSAAVRHVDRCVGRTIAALKANARWDNTLFVFFADHGESLGEHGRTEQHSTCYMHDIRIPLVFRVPAMSAARHESYRIQLSDLLPTTANLLGLSVNGETIEGDDLSGLFDERLGAHTRGAAFSRGHPLQYRCAGVLSESWHLIYTKSGQFYELYDIDQDPLEVNNLVGSHGFIVEKLRPLLDAYFVHYQGGTSEPKAVDK